MAKLADALDLGSSGRPWGFKSLHPHHVGSTPFFLVLLVAKLYLWATAHISPITHQCLWGPHLDGGALLVHHNEKNVTVAFTGGHFFIPLRTSAYGDPRRNLIYWQIACAIIAFLICCSSSHLVPFGHLWEPYTFFIAVF